MNPDLNWWAGLIGTLAVETAVLVLLAKGIAWRCPSARDRRLVWRITTLALLMATGVELAGLRPAFPTAWFQASSPRTLQLQVREPLPESNLPQRITADLPALEPVEPRPIWWPGWVWLAGAAAFAARNLAARAKLAWRCLAGRQDLDSTGPTAAQVEALRTRLGLGPIRVRVWDGLKGPIVFGIWRPTLVVPSDFQERFSTEQAQAILAHELSHLASRDPAWLAVAQLMVTLQWWNPWCGWTARELRRASEAAADEGSQLLPGGRIALAESLVILGRELLSPTERTRLGVAGSGPSSELGRRVRALLDTRSPVDSRPWSRRVWMVLGAMVGSGLLLLPFPGAQRAGLPKFLSTAVAAAAPAAPTVPEAGAPSARDAEPQGNRQSAANDSIPVYHHIAEPFSPFPKPSLAYGILPESSTATAVYVPLPQDPVHSGAAPVPEGSRLKEESRNVLALAASTAADTDRVTGPNSTPQTPSLATRTWRVSPERVLGHLNVPQASDGSYPDATEALRRSLSAAGIDLPPLAPGTRTPDPARKAIFFRANFSLGIVFARATPAELDAIESEIARMQPAETQARLVVHLVELNPGGSEDTGLDWLFGQSPTNNPAPEFTTPTGTLPGAGMPFSDRVQVEKLSIQGQAAILSQDQFAALRERLGARGGNDWLTAPGIVAISGRKAQVTIQDIRTIVTGPRVVPETATNGASLLYESTQVGIGPVVDVLPVDTGLGWKIDVSARFDEFMGYADPGNSKGPTLKTSTGTLSSTEALPRFRTRELIAEGHLAIGQTLALRGPEAPQVIRFKDKVPVLGDIPILGRLFRKEGSQSIPKRLYVFVTVEKASPEGNTGAPGEPRH